MNEEKEIPAECDWDRKECEEADDKLPEPEPEGRRTQTEPGKKDQQTN